MKTEGGLGTCWGEVRRSSSQVIRVQLYEHEGREFVRLETWLKAVGEDGQGFFTGKGYALNAKVWAELVPIIEAAAGEGVRRRRVTRSGGESE